MKSTLKVCIWVALIVSATIAQAGLKDSTVEVEITGDKTFSITLNGQHAGVQSLLKDKKGHVLAEQAFTDGIHTLDFDLKDAREGSYRIELIDAQEMISLPVELVGDDVSIDVKEMETYYFPVVYQRGDLVTVSKWASEKEIIGVSIVDDSNILVYEDKISGDKTLAKRFDFSRVRSGNYELVLKCNDQVLIKSVAIK